VAYAIEFNVVAPIFLIRHHQKVENKASKIIQQIQRYMKTT
jgi:hypothetical protein